MAVGISHNKKVAFVIQKEKNGNQKSKDPADQPLAADFTLIVNGTHAYVFVDGTVVGEYTLAQSKILKGDIGLSLLSGTNKDYGTRCKMTDIHIWTPTD